MTGRSLCFREEFIDIIYDGVTYITLRHITDKTFCISIDNLLFVSPSAGRPNNTMTTTNADQNQIWSMGGAFHGRKLNQRICLSEGPYRRRGRSKSYDAPSQMHLTGAITIRR